MGTGHELHAESRFSSESWERLLRPRSIALVGASPRNEFHSCTIANARQLGYAGRLVPVNPSRSEVFGLAAKPSVSALDEPVDMVAISVPAQHVEGVVEEALATGVRSFVLHTAGYAEAGRDGRQKQRGIVERCVAARATLIGPNGLGLANLHEGVPTIGTILPAQLPRGPVGLIAQSGSAACALIESGRPLGYSVVASTGNEAVVTAEDLMEVLLEDDGTQVLALFLESLRDGRRFRTLMARAHALGKPVVVLKVGSTPVAKSVMALHTGRLAVDDRLASALFRDLGVMTVSNYDEMIELLYLLTTLRGRRVSRRLGVLSTSGGELSMIADTAVANGLQTPPIAGATRASLAAAVDAPTESRVENPFDIGGIPNDQSGETLGRTFLAAVRDFARDPAIATVAVFEHMHQTIHDDMVGWYLASARGVARAAAATDVPVVAVSMLSADIQPDLQACYDEVGVPVLRGLLPGLRALEAAAREPRELRGEPAITPPRTVERWAAALARKGRGRLLDERDAKNLLAAAGVPVVEDRHATTPEEAVQAAESLGYPVVLKIVSPSIFHKTDVGGVRLGLTTADQVTRAFEQIARSVAAAEPAAEIRGVLVAPQVPVGAELVVGGVVDETLGPMVMVGIGGVFVEAVQDVVFGLAPISPSAARSLLGELKARAVLEGFRGRPPVDQEGVADVIARVSELVASGDVLGSIEINPLVADERSVRALDAKVALRG